MANTSATGGPLLPTTTPAPVEDDALADLLIAWMVGITGLPGDMVRPRWQPEPPNVPNETVNWVGVGIVRRVSDTNAVELHFETDPGYNELRRHQTLHLLASFYGPNSNGFAEVFQDGIQIAQNREFLTVNNMGLIESGEIVSAPEMVKNKWYNRSDITFSIRRQLVRHYPVLNILSAAGSIETATVTTTVTTTFNT